MKYQKSMLSDVESNTTLNGHSFSIYVCCKNCQYFVFELVTFFIYCQVLGKIDYIEYL